MKSAFYSMATRMKVFVAAAVCGAAKRLHGVAAALLCAAVALLCAHTAAAAYPETSYTLQGRKLVAWHGPERSVDLRDDPALARVNAIADYAFAQTDVEEVALPDRLMIVPTGAFEGCVHLQRVRLGANTRFIREAAFAGCKSLETIDFPKRLLYIGPFAFDGAGLTAVDLADTEVLEYGMDAFARCPALRTAVLAETVPLELGENLFRDCTALTEFTLPQAWTEVSHAMFAGCRRLAAVTLDGDLKAIADSAFTGCEALRSLSLGENLVSIGADAFAGCSGLRLVYFPESLHSVGDDAFAGCTSLEMLFFGDRVRQIGNNAFAGCTALRHISLGAEEPPALWGYAFSDVYEPEVMLSVPSQAEDSYRGEPQWGRFNINPLSAIDSDFIYTDTDSNAPAVLFSLDGRRLTLPPYVKAEEAVTLTGYAPAGFYILCRPGMLPTKVIIR